MNSSIKTRQSGLRSEPLIASGRIAYGLAVASGFLYFLAFPGIDLWPLSFVALAPLIVALRGQGARRATGLGWVAGMTMTMFGFYWMLGMLRDFGGFSLPVCLLMMLVVCAYQSGRIALLGWFTGRAQERGWPPGIAFSLAFVASELLYPLLFPWYYAATLHPVPVLMQTLELGGPIFLALILVAANLAVAEIVIARLRRDAVERVRVAALAAVPLAAAVYGFVRIPQIDAQVAAAPKARVGLIQANMSLLGKRLQPEEGLDRHVKLTRELAAREPVDFVVWSETSDMNVMDEPMADRLYPTRFTNKLGVPAIFGGILARRVYDAREFAFLNSALASDRSGQITGRYDKQSLLAFGEYLPLGERFPVLYRWLPNTGKYIAGSNVAPLRIAGHDATVCICYEDIIPSFLNGVMSKSNSELLVNMTNDAWFGDTTAPWIHLGLARLRAVEHRRYLVRATNSGVSAIVDPVGRIVTHTRTFEQTAQAAQIAWLRSTTLYERLGDVPWWIATAAMGVMSFVRRGRIGARQAK